jgi:hypothetical protein
MGEFTADWLALREPADARARSATLTALIAERLRHDAPLRVLDLAAGTGANARYLAVALSAGQHGQRWLLVDNDRTLLAIAALKMQGRHAVEIRELDLVTAFEPAALNICAGRDLVTASALLDLVSGPWLHLLAAKCREAGAAVLLALTYNGDIRCSPDEPEDDEVRELVNRHQRRDKGFGPALGPDACEEAAQSFAARGYQVRRERSDWALEPDAHDLQAQLIEGWASAAADMAPDRSGSLQDWKARRLEHVAAGRSRLVVGHEDLAAWL